jgi:hypothetical protein
MSLSAPVLSPRLESPATPRYRATVSLLVQATPADCFEVLTDFDAYPRWSSAVKSCQVAARGKDGLARHVDFELEIARRRIRYTLGFQYAAPTGARWFMIEGDLAGIVGSYQFADTGVGVMVSCSQAVDVGFWIPELIRRPLEQRSLRRSVEEFGRAVETRAGGWA